MQLIYTGNTKRGLSNFNFPSHFNIKFTKNHWPNIEKAVEHFKNVFKDKHRYHKEQMSLVIMDSFKGQNNKFLKELFHKNIFVRF